MSNFNPEVESYSLENNTPFLSEEYREHEEALHHSITNFPISIENVIDMTDEEFTKSRHQNFGGSDSSVLLGVAYHTTKVQMKTIQGLIQEKIEEYNDASIGMKGSVRKGKELESMLIVKAEKMLNAIIIKPKHTYANTRGLSMNFDGIIFEPDTSVSKPATIKPIPFEVKLCTFFGRKNYNWDLGVSEFDNDKTIPKKLLPDAKHIHGMAEKITYRAKELGVPPYYYTQVQDQMLFTEADHGYICVMDDLNWTLYVFYIPRDQEMLDQLIFNSEEAYIHLAMQKGIDIKHMLAEVNMDNI